MYPFNPDKVKVDALAPCKVKQVRRERHVPTPESRALVRDMLDQKLPEMEEEVEVNLGEMGDLRNLDKSSTPGIVTLFTYVSTCFKIKIHPH